MTEFLKFVVSGLVTGALYAVLASGLTLTYQTSGVFNFGQGAIAFATAYLFFELNSGEGLPIVLSAIIAIALFAPLLGLLLHITLFKGLREAPIATRMIATIGLLIALPSACLWIVSLLRKAGVSLPTTEEVYQKPGLGPSPKKLFHPLEGLTVNSDQVAMLVAAVFAALGLWYLTRRTRIGLEMRASVSRPHLASLRGVDPDRASAVSWVVSCTLAGLVGVLLTPLFTLAEAQYDVLLFIAIPAVVFGRMISIPLAMAGGLALGIAQNLIGGYTTIGDEIIGFTDAVPFILLFLLLFFFGREKGRRAGTTLEERPPINHLAALPAWRRRAPWIVIVVLVLGYTGFFADDYWARLLARGLATTLVLLSFTVVTGIGGMVSMAQSAFVLAGAFSAAIMLDAGAPFLVAALVGTAVAAAVGFIVALPTRRLGGLPLALATLALAYIGEKLVYQIRGISGGSSGWELRPPVLGPIDGSNPRILVVIMLVVVGLVVAIIHNLRNSSTGRAMLALRSTETGAITAGIAVGKMKLLIFVISAAIAGFGGIMLASTNGRVTNLDYPVMLGLVWLATTVTLGVRRPAGALLAGLSSALLPEIFNWVPDSNYLLSVLFGLGAVNLAKNPDGVLAMVAELRAGRRGARQPAGPTAGSPAAPVATTVSRPVVVKPAAAADPDQVPVLSLRGIRAGYGEVEVLHGVDLTVAPGEVVALLGSNGAGKTTLSCLVGGLMRPTAGTIELNGVDVTSSTAHVRSRQGVFLAPEGRGVFPDLTVEENLSLWLRDEDERTAAYDAFPILGTRRRQLAGALSGGEQQMLTLAPAIVAPPKLLIADEPSLGLAPLIVDQIFESLRELNRQGVALLVAEEKTRDALGLADRAAFLSVGHFTWIGPAADVDSDLLAGVYLGVGQNEHHGPATGPEAGGGTTEAATAGDAVPAAAEPATGLATPAEPAAAGSTAAAVSAASGASADA